MAITSQVVNVAKKFSPQNRGPLGTAASGMGTDLLMRTVDNFVGSPVQKLFSFNIPIFGTIGPIDVANFLVHAGTVTGKAKRLRDGAIAVLAAKLVGGGLANIGPIRLPTTSSNPVGASTASGAAGGASF